MGLSICLSKKKYEEAETAEELIEILQEEQRNNEKIIDEVDQINDVERNLYYLNLNLSLTELIASIDNNINKINKYKKELTIVKTLIDHYYDVKKSNNKKEISDFNEEIISYQNRLQ